MRIDLHTHSDVSDGTTSPRQLVLDAHAAGLDVVALTDHDTAAGWDEAAAAASEVGITFVPGMELSCRAESGGGVHLLAYLPDPTHPPLVALLQRVLDGREQRVPRMCARLRELGIDVDEAEVRRQAGAAAAVGRPHLADVLVRRGVVADRDEAFARYLSPGRPAYVPRYAAPLVETIEVVRDAGGVSVVAHPWGRRDHADLMADGLAALQAAGLTGVEVDHQDHSAEQRAQLREIARSLGLVVTGSSDYHGAGKRDHELGCNTTEPAELDRLLAAAAEAAAATGRRTPGGAG